MAYFPFLGSYEPHNTVAWYKGQSMNAQTVLSHVQFISNQLPPKRYVINLCQDRYAFLIGLAASLCQDQITLLPPNRSPKTLQLLCHEYPDSYHLTDGPDQIAGSEGFTLNIDAIPLIVSSETLQFPDSQIAAIAFTSGTTGTPQPNPKSWGSMIQIAQKTGERLALSGNGPATIIATVPHQHMYGLETTIMLPLQKAWAIHSGRPFFPEDIASVLQTYASPRILVSTPIHLRACVLARAEFPKVRYTLSATAPLSRQLAKLVETVLHTTMVEIYGFAEAGTIATRHPLQEDSWTLLSELNLRIHNDTFAVASPYFSNPVPIPDTIHSSSPQQFTLKGRPSHMVNIGGHRASLDDLNIQLLSIEGVKDGIFYMPEDQKDSVTRLIAFVVAPGKSSDSILAALRTKIASPFLPRPIYLVETLPRNQTGKLLKDDIIRLLETHKG